jgi:hypothetical protein
MSIEKLAHFVSAFHEAATSVIHTVVILGDPRLQQFIRIVMNTSTDLRAEGFSESGSR